MSKMSDGVGMTSLTKRARTRPQDIVWGEPEEVQIVKNMDNKLGFNFVNVRDEVETYSIVTSIGNECTVQQGDLSKGCRIIEVNRHNITHESGEKIHRLLLSTTSVAFLCVRKATGLLPLSRIEDSHVTNVATNHLPLTKTGSSSSSNASGDHLSNITGVIKDTNNHVQVTKKTSNSSSNASIGHQSGMEIRPLVKNGQEPLPTKRSSSGSNASADHLWSTESAVSVNLESVSAQESGGQLGSSRIRQVAAADNNLIGYVLKSPHRVRWHERMLKLEIKNVPGAKLLEKKCKRSKADIYLLVTLVESSSPAYGVLKAGDWIRSVNGVPIHDEETARKFQGIIENCQEPTITMHVQRPFDILEASSSSSVTQVPSGVTQVTSISDIRHVPSTCVESIPSTSANNLFEVPKTVSTDPQLQAAFNSIVSKALNKPTNYFPQSKVIVIGSNSEMVAKYVLGCDSQPTSHLLRNVHKRVVRVNCKDREVLITPPDGYTSTVDECLAHQVIKEVFESTTLDECARVQISKSLMHNNIQDVRGIDGQLLARLLADGGVVNSALFDLEITCLKDTPVAVACRPILFSHLAQFVLTFNVDELLENGEYVMSRLFTNLTEIRFFTGKDTPVLLVCCGAMCSDVDVCGILDSYSLRSLFSSHLVYNRSSKCPVFHLCMSHGRSCERSGDTDNLKQAIINYAVRFSMAPQKYPLASFAFLKQIQKMRSQKHFIIAASTARCVLEDISGPINSDYQHQVLSCLHSMGEIVYKDRSDSCIFINTDVLFACAKQLFMVPAKVDQTRRWRSDWEKLEQCGLASKDFLLAPRVTDGDEVKGQHVLACFQWYGLVFTFGDEFLLPHFMPKLCNRELSRTTSLDSLIRTGRELYIQFTEPPHLTVIYELYSRCSKECASRGGKSDVVDRYSAVFRQEVLEYLMRYTPMSSMIKVIVRSGDGVLNPFLLQLQDIVRDVLKHSSYSCVIGPACPASECVELGSLHVLDLAAQPPVHCGIEQLDTHPDVCSWLPSEVRNPVVRVFASAHARKPVSMETRLNNIPEGLAQVITNLYNIPMTLGRDWTHLAAELGLTITAIARLKMVDDPCRAIILNWATTGATVKNLLDVSESLERLDVCEDVMEWINSQQQQ